MSWSDVIISQSHMHLPEVLDILWQFVLFWVYLSSMSWYEIMAKEVLRINSELLKTFHRRLYHYNYCQCRTLVYSSAFPSQQKNPAFSLSSRLKSTKNTKSEKAKKDINSLVQPVSVKPYVDPDGINIGEELTGTLKKGLNLVIAGLA